MPAWRRWLILNLFILPFRPRKSGEAYSQIWTEQGSPLLVIGREFERKIRERLGSGVEVELAMRYGNPSIPDALDRLRRNGVQRIVVLPLFPQYSSAATGSAIQEVTTRAAQAINTPYLQVVPPFYDDPGFIRSFAAVTRPQLERVRPERVFFSFHGLPERQVRDADDRGHGCLESPGCCDAMVPGNLNCYRAQCYETARLLAAELNLNSEQVVVCFQSRLGRIPWIRPYTDEVVVEAARSGCRRGLILSPAFVADCLETLEELGLRAAESFRENGGDTLELVPSLNAEDLWVDAALAFVRQHTTWLDESR